MVDTPTLWIDVTQVNTSDAGTAQGDGQIVALRDGGYVIVWTDASGVHDDQSTIVGQRYDVLGEKVGEEVPISPVFNDGKIQPAITLLTDDTIAIAFARENGDVHVRRFDATLAFTGQDTILIGGSDGADPSITAFGNGSYLVAYGFDVGGGDSNILGRIVQADGTGANVNVDTNDDVKGPSAAATLSNGNAVVAYADANSDVIKFAIVTPTGTLSPGPATVAGTAQGDDFLEFEVDVAALKGGGFVVTWTEFDLTDPDLDNDIRVTILNNAGGVVDDDILVNTNTDGDQDKSTVVGLADGGFLVVWQDSDLGEYRGQRFAANGNKIGAEYTVKDGLSTDLPDSALLSDGRVAYSIGDVSTGDADVVTAIFDPRTSPLSGTSGDDFFTSRRDGATVLGRAGDDKLFGLEDKDVLDGGSGEDTLRGGGDNDVLIGGKQRDIMFGDAGRDIFDFNAPSETKKGTQRDKINHFKRGQNDKIDLEDIDAKTGIDGNQKFSFIGKDEFSDTKGELRFKVNGSTVIVQGDRNGDGTADFEIFVNVGTLSKGDFLL